MNTATQPYSEFGYYIHRVVNLLDKRGELLFRARLDISLTQFMLLRFIDAGATNPPSQQALAQQLGIAKSATSRHIAIAQQRGWLEAKRSPASRRQNVLVLTPAGNDLLAKAKILIKESESLGFGDMPSADVEATVRTLKNLHEKLTAVSNPMAHAKKHQ